MTKAYISPEIRAKIHYITVYTRRLLTGMLVGDSRAAQKGMGFEFTGIREYQQGDDVRCIDWRASSRANALLIKEYIESKSATIFLALDVSASGGYVSVGESKRDIGAQIAGVLSLVAGRVHDAVGLILFSDQIEKYIPPSRGAAHINTLIETIFAWQSRSTKTKSSVAFDMLLQLKKRNAIVFFISDCIDADLSKKMNSVAKMYDMIVVRLLDQYEQSLPPIGFVTMQDIETGQFIEVDLRLGMAQVLQDRVIEQNKLFKRCGAHLLEIKNHHNIIPEIVRFFRQRMLG